MELIYLSRASYATPRIDMSIVLYLHTNQCATFRLPMAVRSAKFLS